MIAWWWASRPGRTLALYLDSRGPLLARGMSFSAVFSVFAAVYVFFAIFGILDPTKVTRSALQNAASIAGLMITTEAMVAELPKKDEPAMPGGGGMGGMGGMDF